MRATDKQYGKDKRDARHKKKSKLQQSTVRHMPTVEAEVIASPNLPAHWCSVCKLDLQSKKSLAEHELGIKHSKRLQRQVFTNVARETENNQETPLLATIRYRPPVIDEEEFFQNLANGMYKNIVVVTGAGVSTAAGIPDFRSKGGLYETLQQQYKGRFPGISIVSPEILFSRAFARMHPEIYENEILPSKQKVFQNAQPTLAHKFCAYLYRVGWLRRTYTQNIDGLHSHPSLGIDDENGVVVECHGAIRKGTIVLYGDDLPKEFSQKAGQDFSINPISEKAKVDLVLVLGTSLQVAPVCGLPNMALKGCTRVLVNRSLSHCMVNNFSVVQSPPFDYYGTGLADTCDIGGRKNVKLRPLWRDQKATKKWSQLLVEDDCDAFVEGFMKATGTSIGGDGRSHCTSNHVR